MICYNWLYSSDCKNASARNPDVNLTDDKCIHTMKYVEGYKGFIDSQNATSYVYNRVSVFCKNKYMLRVVHEMLCKIRYSSATKHWLHI